MTHNKRGSLSRVIHQQCGRVYTWLGVSFERSAIAVVLGIGAILAIFILTMKPGGSATGHEHSGHSSEGEAHDEHAEDADQDTEISLSAAAIAASGITTDLVADARIHRTINVSGRIVPNRDRYTVIRPRFPGAVTRVVKDLGEKVNKGDLLAVIESNSARAAFEVRTGISGVIIARQIIAGAFAPENEAIFEIADLSSVWVEINISDRDFSLVAVDDSMQVRDAFAAVEATVAVSYISPVVDEDTQSLLLRAQLPNPEGKWKIGSFIDAKITIEDSVVPITVKRDAVQSLDGHSVVFVEKDEHFHAKRVQLGRGDQHNVEIIAGVDLNDAYVSTNSFILKAELLKSSAAHEH